MFFRYSSFLTKFIYCMLFVERLSPTRTKMLYIKSVHIFITSHFLNASSSYFRQDTENYIVCILLEKCEHEHFYEVLNIF